MVGKSQIKLIKSLRQKKFREANALFVAEGRKSVRELLVSRFECVAVYAEPSAEGVDLGVDVTPVTPQQMRQMSALKTPSGVLGLFRMPKASAPEKKGVALALDDVRDPGNLGTIIRLCDWFGITQLICSSTTVDCYNPKVVQATMGSLARVQVSYVNLEVFLKQEQRPVLIADMDGQNIYKSNWPEEMILVMGNEANGVSPQIQALASGVMSIPRFGNDQSTESLNVATATAILLSEFRRNNP